MITATAPRPLSIHTRPRTVLTFQPHAHEGKQVSITKYRQTSHALPTCYLSQEYDGKTHEHATTPTLRPAPPSPGVWVGAPPPPVRVQVPLGEPDRPLVVLLLGVVVGAPRRKSRPVVETGMIIWRTVHGRCMKARRSEIWSALVSSRERNAIDVRASRCHRRE